MSGDRARLRFGFVTHAGLERERNEDAFVVYAPYEGEPPVGAFDALFVVADGMGGHESGDVASRFVADYVAAALTRDVQLANEIEPATHIEEVMRRADADLRELVRAEGLQHGAGSTLTLAAWRGHTLHLGHVGDSRVYRLRAGALTQLTEDHSWVADQVRAGLLSIEEAVVHPKRNLLTQSIGVGNDLRVFSAAHAAVAGDRYMICTDGLHGVVPAETLARVLAEEADAQSAAARLVSIANEAGGPDNITCVVFDVQTPATQTAPGALAPLSDTLPLSSDTLRDVPATNLTITHTRPARRLLPHALLAAGVVLVMSAGALGAWRYYAAQPAVTNGRATAADSTRSATDTRRAAGSSAQDTTAQPAAIPDSARDSPRGSR